jgi:hypothetical protein
MSNGCGLVWATQTQHHDKDERFMATNDLIGELEAVEGAFDASLQTPIRVAVLKQFEDSSTDVQTVAVKWYVVVMEAPMEMESTDMLEMMQ